jgi:hypothetical protein
MTWPEPEKRYILARAFAMRSSTSRPVFGLVLGRFGRKTEVRVVVVASAK